MEDQRTLYILQKRKFPGQKKRPPVWGQLMLTRVGIKPVTLVSDLDYSFKDTEEPYKFYDPYRESTGVMPLDRKTYGFREIYFNFRALERILTDHYYHQHFGLNPNIDITLESKLKKIFNSEELLDKSGHLLGYPISSKPRPTHITYHWVAPAPSKEYYPSVEYMWFGWNNLNIRDVLEIYKRISPYVYKIESNTFWNWETYFRIEYRGRRDKRSRTIDIPLSKGSEQEIARALRKVYEHLSL